MALVTLTNGTLLIDDEVRAQAAALVSESHDRNLGAVTFALDDGSSEQLPANLSRFLVALVERIAGGGAVTMTTLPDQLTTTVAADLLGISRPTLMKLVANGELKATRVGSHTRISSAEALALRTKRFVSRASAFEELRRAEEALD